MTESFVFRDYEHNEIRVQVGPYGKETCTYQ